MTDVIQKTVGDIGTYYGSLEVKSKDGKFYWSIEDYDGHDWQEIPKYLYDALIKFDLEDWKQRPI